MSLPDRVPGDGEVPVPVGGPTHAVPATPELRAGGVRRTSSVAISRSDGFAGRALGDVRGRDVRRRADGQTEVIDEIEVTVEIDAVTGDLVGIGASDDLPHELRELTGANLRRGYGRALVEAWPDGGATRSLLYSVLEDLGGAFLVSGYAPLREGREAWPREMGVLMADAQEDVCAGWARGGALVGFLRRTGRSPVPIGPHAPPITDGAADRWHRMPAITPSTVRRLRCLDVGAGLDPPHDLEAVAHFRDSYEGEDVTTVMHEYLVRARFDAADLALAEASVEARVLPWESCPSAVPSASRVVGAKVAELATRVRAEMTGPSTCTHLNSTMRSLADVDALRRLIA